MKRKVFSLAMSITLLSAVAVPASISAAAPSPFESQSQSQSQNKILNVTANSSVQIEQVLSSASALDPFISVDSDGLLHLDPKGKDVVSSDVFSTIEKGIHILNQSILDGSSIIDSTTNLVVPSGKEPLANSGLSNLNSLKTDIISPMAFYNSYWWGVAITMNNSEARRLAYSMSNLSYAYAGEAGIAAIIASFFSGPPAWAATAAGVIMSAGEGILSNMVNQNNGPNGVTINIHWLLAPYIEVTQNNY